MKTSVYEHVRVLNQQCCLFNSSKIPHEASLLQKLSATKGHHHGCVWSCRDKGSSIFAWLLSYYHLLSCLCPLDWQFPSSENTSVIWKPFKALPRAKLRYVRGVLPRVLWNRLLWVCSRWSGPFEMAIKQIIPDTVTSDHRFHRCQENPYLPQQVPSPASRPRKSKMMKQDETGWNRMKHLVRPCQGFLCDQWYNLI